MKKVFYALRQQYRIKKRHELKGIHSTGVGWCKVWYLQREVDCDKVHFYFSSCILCSSIK